MKKSANKSAVSNESNTISVVGIKVRTYLNGNEMPCTECPLKSQRPEKKSKMQSKLDALREAGVDVSNYYSITGPEGEDMVGRMAGGRLSIVADDDPVFDSIRKQGAVPNRRLFRRWVMGQMFHMLTEKGWRSNKPMGFSEALRRKGYEYQWKMVVEELRVQSKLYRKDKENFGWRNRWFNQEVIQEMAQDYIYGLRRHIDSSKRRMCKGRPYIRLQGVNIFVSDLYAKVLQPLDNQLIDIFAAKTPERLYLETEKFYKLIKTICMNPFDKVMQSKAFVDAYKGVGAFYTMRNLIMFHCCTFYGLNRDESLDHLENLNSDVLFEGYKLLGVLKEFIQLNHIDIEAKRAEWRK